MIKKLDIEEKPFLHGYYYAASFMSIASCKARFDKSDAVISDLIWKNGRKKTFNFHYDKENRNDNSYVASVLVFPENIKKNNGSYNVFLGKYNNTFYESAFLYNKLCEYNQFSFKLETMKKVFRWSMAGIMIIDEKYDKSFKAVFTPDDIIQISSDLVGCKVNKEIDNSKQYKYLMTKVSDGIISVYASCSGKEDYQKIFQTKCDIDIELYKIGFFLWIGEDYFENWFYSNYIQLHCHKDLITYGDLKFNYYTTPMVYWRYNLTNPWLENYIVPRNYVDNNDDIFDFIRKSINDEYYVSIHLNEKYMKEKWAYNKCDFEHESLIYGIDDDKEILYFMSFNQNQIFEPYIIDFYDFIKAYDSVGINNSIELLKYKIPNDGYKLSVDLIETMLNEYITGKNSSYREALSKNIDNRAYGIEVYHVIMNNIEKLKDKRIIYILYEHKLVMKKRLAFFHKNDLISNEQYNVIEQEINAVCDDAEHLLMFCLKYSITDNENLVNKITEKINKISANELSLLKRVVTILKIQK